MRGGLSGRAAPDGSVPDTFYSNNYKPETVREYEITFVYLHRSYPRHTSRARHRNRTEAGSLIHGARRIQRLAEGWRFLSESRWGDELGLYG